MKFLKFYALLLLSILWTANAMESRLEQTSIVPKGDWIQIYYPNNDLNSLYAITLSRFVRSSGPKCLVRIVSKGPKQNKILMLPSDKVKQVSGIPTSQRVRYNVLPTKEQHFLQNTHVTPTSGRRSGQICQVQSIDNEGRMKLHFISGPDTGKDWKQALTIGELDYVPQADVDRVTGINERARREGVQTNTNQNQSTRGSQSARTNQSNPRTNLFNSNLYDPYRDILNSGNFGGDYDSFGLGGMFGSRSRNTNRPNTNLSNTNRPNTRTTNPFEFSDYFGGNSRDPFSEMMGVSSRDPFSEIMGGSRGDPFAEIMGGSSRDPFSSFFSGSDQNPFQSMFGSTTSQNNLFNRYGRLFTRNRASNNSNSRSRATPDPNANGNIHIDQLYNSDTAISLDTWQEYFASLANNPESIPVFVEQPDETKPMFFAFTEEEIDGLIRSTGKNPWTQQPFPAKSSMWKRNLLRDGKFFETIESRAAAQFANSPLQRILELKELLAKTIDEDKIKGIKLEILKEFRELEQNRSRSESPTSDLNEDELNNAKPWMGLMEAGINDEEAARQAWEEKGNLDEAYIRAEEIMAEKEKPEDNFWFCKYCEWQANDANFDECYNCHKGRNSDVSSSEKIDFSLKVNILSLDSEDNETLFKDDDSQALISETSGETSSINDEAEDILVKSSEETQFVTEPKKNSDTDSHGDIIMLPPN